MTTSPLTITPTASLTLAPGQEGRFSFTVTSQAAPDKVREVTLQALLVGEDGKGKEVDWLVVGPQRTLSLAGGKTETITITARPTTASPPGKNTIKLAIAIKDGVDDVYVDSPTVACEVTATAPTAIASSPPTSPVLTPPERIRPPRNPLFRWLIPAIVGGLLLVGGGVLAGWKLLGHAPVIPTPIPTTPHALGELCGSDPAAPCDKGLLCVTGAQKCLLASGASCKPEQADLCASGECETKTEICTIPLGGTCDPGDKEQMPCPKLSTCDPATKTCEKNTGSACKAGTQQCTTNGAGISSCGNDGKWKTVSCPASAPQCRSGRCQSPVVQCSANKGKACNCEGTIQCNGTCSTAACSGTCTNGRCCVFSEDPACDPKSLPVRRLDFNSYILRAIDLLYQQFPRRGYSAGTAYTHDLDYSQPHEIKAGPNAPATMCVAAVSEVIIVALKLYADERKDLSVFTKLPARSWIKASATDIRPYMFLYDTVDSNGTADALQHFGIGEHTPFPALVPGDFIGLNRENRSGHAVVFLGFLNALGQIEPNYDSKKVVGFKYFSAQGNASPNAGLGYRWAFFGSCPRWHESDKLRDCGIVLSDNQTILNTGYMLHPTQWTTEPALSTLRSALIQKHSVKLLAKQLGRAPTHIDLTRMSRAESLQLQQQATRELQVELPATSRLKFDGKTTDD
jgi:hypothetical protein